MAMEWPCVARIRWWAGLRGSGNEVELESDGESEGREGSGIRAKRCLALVSTIALSSGNVTDMEERRFQDS